MNRLSIAVAGITVLLLCSTGAIADSGTTWSPLTQKEIDDAHSCFAGGQLMVCAGEKHISTGLWFHDESTGTQVIGYKGKIQDFRYVPTSDFAVNFLIRLRQSLESGGPAWQKEYYVISDEQLAGIIRKARREPDWKP